MRRPPLEQNDAAALLETCPRGGASPAASKTQYSGRIITPSVKMAKADAESRETPAPSIFEPIRNTECTTDADQDTERVQHRRKLQQR